MVASNRKWPIIRRISEAEIKNLRNEQEPREPAIGDHRKDDKSHLCPSYRTYSDHLYMWPFYVTILCGRLYSPTPCTHYSRIRILGKEWGWSSPGHVRTPSLSEMESHSFTVRASLRESPVLDNQKMTREPLISKQCSLRQWRESHQEIQRVQTLAV